MYDVEKKIYYDLLTDSALYLGHNPIIRLMLNIMGKKVSQMEVKIRPCFRSVVRATWFTRLLFAFGIMLTLEAKP